MSNTKILASLALIFASVVPLAAQHMQQDKAAPETEADKLHEELGQAKKILEIVEMKVAKDTTIVTICEHGGRSSHAAMELQKMGYKTVSYCRLDHWRAKDYKVEKGEAKPKKSARLPGHTSAQLT
jgi:rhodanese-related sulfurtransferase